METSIWKSGDYHRVEKAILFLERNIHSQPTLDDIADHLHLSKFHFQRLFTRWAGISPTRFLRFLTLKHAQTLLEESRSVLDSALDSGLSGPSRLHDLFIDLEGISPGEFKRGGEGLNISYGYHPSPFGEMLLACTSRGICGLAFISPKSRAEALMEFSARWPGAVMAEATTETGTIAHLLFQQEKPALLNRLSLQMSGTNFQIKVWEALLRIPEGEVCTYQDIATAIGSPKASRAVGSAIGKNPVAFLIPCHRVIRKTGDFGAYHWGATRKKALLAWEAARHEQAESLHASTG